MKQRINLLLRSKILVGIVLTGLFLLGMVLIAQGFINTDYYRAQIQDAVKSKTGKDLSIRGEVSVALLPTPTLYLPGIELRDAAGDSPAPSLTADMAYIRATVASVFSLRPELDSVALENPVLQVERAEDNLIHWDWLNHNLLGLIDDPMLDRPVGVQIINGKVLYRNRRSNGEWLAEDISLQGAIGNKANMSGKFTVYGHRLSLEAKIVPDAPRANESILPVHLRFFSGENNSLKFEGAIDISTNEPQITGQVSLGVENILEWTQAKTEQKSQLLDQITNASAPTEEQTAKLPLSFSGEWAQTGDSVVLGNIQLQGLGSAGSGSVELTWPDDPHVSAGMKFSLLDYGQWRQLAQALRRKNTEDDGKSDEEAMNPLPDDLSVVVKLEAERMMVDGQAWKNASLSAALDHAAVTVNQFSVIMPGDSSLSLFGILSQGTSRGLRFEGNMETKGESLRDMLAVFDASARELPDIGMGAFSVRSNLYVAADQMRLSEADAQIGDLNLNGGLVAYYDARPRLEADVKLQDINLDYFRDSWREKQKNSAQKFFLQYDRGIGFQWLRKLHASVDFRINIDGFTFLERQGRRGSFRLFAKEGEFGIYNMLLNYPEDTLEANFNLNVMGENPSVTLLLNASRLNTDYFRFDPEAPIADFTRASDEGKRWPEDIIDMSWMEGLAGAFDISIGALTHHGTDVSNLKLSAKLESNLLNLQTLSFDYWQGKCNVNGYISGGKVPAVSIGLTLYNVELRDLLGTISGRDNISGKASLSGTLETSGVNVLSWVSQLKSELVLAARGVNVRNFNLQAVADAMTVSRTAADVVNNVNLALVNGSSELSVDGNINIKDSVVRTPGMTLKSGAVVGNLTGEVKLVPWTMQLSALYQFSTPASETVPTMTTQIFGDIGSPEMQVDTSSLEAYVAKRLIGSSIDK